MGATMEYKEKYIKDNDQMNRKVAKEKQLHKSINVREARASLEPNIYIIPIQIH